MATPAGCQVLEAWTRRRTVSRGRKQHRTLGYTFGWLDENKAKKGSTLVELSYGRYVAVWRRQGREWQVESFLRLGGTAPLPPPPPDALIVDGGNSRPTEPAN